MSDFNSAGLREQQLEEGNFNIVSLQKSIGDLNMQVAYFNRYSLTHFFPDPVRSARAAADDEVFDRRRVQDTMEEGRAR